MAESNKKIEEIEKSLNKVGNADSNSFPLNSSAIDSGIISPEKRDFEEVMFMDPALVQLQNAVFENTKHLENSLRHSGNEISQKKKNSGHLPGPLPTSCQKLSNVMQHLEDLILYENLDDELEGQLKHKVIELCPLDDHAKIAVLAHSIIAYLGFIEANHLRKITSRIVSDTNLWLARLFRFFESSAYFHDDSREGIVRLCRLVLHKKYSKYISDGFEALYPRPPVIYISAASKTGLGPYICTQLGLPQTCLCTVPCNSIFGSQYKMDIAALEKLIQDDLASSKTPLLIIANAGTPDIGHVDNLQRLQEISKKYGAWLHVEGNSLATLCLLTIPNSIMPARTGDSITLNIGIWLGLPGIPYVTLYKASEPTLVHAAGLSSFNPHLKLNCLPMWLCLQTLGQEEIVKKIRSSCELSKHLQEHLKYIPKIRQLGQEDNILTEGKCPTSISDIVSKAVNTYVLFELLTPTVVFQYVDDHLLLLKDPAAGGDNQGEFPDRPIIRNSSYYDALNTWLGQMLLREVPKVHVDVIDVEHNGVCIRYCPIETAQVVGTTLTDLDEFLECLNKQVNILNATVKHKAQFHSLLETKDGLQAVDIPNWAGLGGVRYIPDTWKELLTNLPEKGLRDLNKLNRSLLSELRSRDNAFSGGEGDDELYFIRFGMVTEDTDLEELVNSVHQMGKELEDSSKFLETMAEIVKKGIEAADQDLKRENEEKLLQEGVLRHVPIVGSLLNWWSPSPKESGIRGRTFDLTSGTVESTETTYKYHMQIQPSSPHSKDSGNKSNLLINRPHTPIPTALTPSPKSSRNVLQDNDISQPYANQSSPNSSPRPSQDQNGMGATVPEGNVKHSIQSPQANTVQ